MIWAKSTTPLSLSLSHCSLSRRPSSPATTTITESTTTVNQNIRQRFGSVKSVDPNPSPVAILSQPSALVAGHHHRHRIHHHHHESLQYSTPLSLIFLSRVHPCRSVKTRSGSTGSRLNRGLWRFRPVLCAHWVEGVDRIVSSAGRRVNRSNRPIRSGFQNLALNYFRIFF